MSSAGNVRSVSCSWHCVYVISRDGLCNVYNTTTGRCHCLMDDDDGVSSSVTVTSAESNDVMTLAVTCDRHLLSFSCHGHVERPLAGVTVQTVSCGRSHCLVLSAIGVVFSCGLGSHGQLGHGDLQCVDSLRLVEALEGVRMSTVCAGGWHSMALSDCGDLYVWGWNDVGQLGLTRSRDTVCYCALLTDDLMTSIVFAVVNCVCLSIRLSVTTRIVSIRFTV